MVFYTISNMMSFTGKNLLVWYDDGVNIFYYIEENVCQGFGLRRLDTTFVSVESPEGLLNADAAFVLKFVNNGTEIQTQHSVTTVLVGCFFCITFPIFCSAFCPASEPHPLWAYRITRMLKKTEFLPLDKQTYGLLKADYGAFKLNMKEMKLLENALPKKDAKSMV